MIAVCDISALARWGEVGLAERLGGPCAPPAHSPWWLSSARELRTIDLRRARIEATAQRPLHVLVPSDEARLRAHALRCHIWSTPLPEGALWRLTPDVLLASPEFCLQQMAPRSSEARICRTAMEVVGCYARSPRAPHGFYKRPPLMGLDELVRHFDENHGYGARRVRLALRWVVEGSRSPMETVLVPVLVLPEELGGCGLARPQLNYRLEIPPSLQRAIERPYVVCDLCWPEWGVILEYDSYEFHTAPRSVDSDNARNEGLRDLGWMVRSVSAGMLTNDAMLDELVGKVMARAGRELPDDPQWRSRRRALVRELMGE